jgi:hypothetical protein
MLSTREKIAIARVLNLAIVGARRVAGRTPHVSVRRRQVRWVLDLNEGIDLAIYLGLYQRVPRRAVRWIAPGALVLDIGANIGAHSLPLAHAVGPDGPSSPSSPAIMHSRASRPMPRPIRSCCRSSFRSRRR